MHASACTVRYINIASVINFEVVGLYSSFTSFLTVDLNTAIRCVLASCWDVIPNFRRVERITYVDNSHPSIKPSNEDEFFVERRLYPNVDFYSGIILKAIGIPTEMFTVIFTTGRTPGWIAHWKEMVSVAYKIGRPRQLYTGSGFRDFVPINER